MNLFFDSPISDVSFYYTSTISANRVVALDANGRPISTYLLQNNFGSSDPISIAGSNIAALDFTFSMVGGNTIDDLSFTQASAITPSPPASPCLAPACLA